MKRAVPILVAWFFFAMQYVNGAALTSFQAGPFDSEAACLNVAAFYRGGAVDFYTPGLTWIIGDCYSGGGTIYSPNLVQP